MTGAPPAARTRRPWKKYGADRCAQQNLSLTDVKPQTMCAGGYASVTYVCCGQGGAVIVTPPPNEICDAQTNADGSQCKTCYYSDGDLRLLLSDADRQVAHSSRRSGYRAPSRFRGTSQWRLCAAGLGSVSLSRAGVSR